MDAPQHCSKTWRFRRSGLPARTLFEKQLPGSGVFPWFHAWFHHDNQYSYIGQSKNRNFSKQLGVSKNISIDSGVIIFDELTKVSRTIHLPHSLTEIHGIFSLVSDNSLRCCNSGMD